MNYMKIVMIVSMLITSIIADTQIENIFKKSGINGSLVISTINEEEYIYNKTRANTRYLPGSTFKIPNTLIALQENVINDQYETLKWDGKIRSYEPWNKDQNLKSAFPISCVWCYQELAKRIGNDKYLQHLKNLNYGNEKTGPDLTTFWLSGDIKISVNEQIKFLKKLYKSELPYKKEYINILKEIMIVEKTDEYILRVKTGWTQDIGWYVGYIETKNKVWFFALNADIQWEQLKYRKQIVMEALKIKNIF